jgi:hypothetical protein
MVYDFDRYIGGSSFALGISALYGEIELKGRGPLYGMDRYLSSIY